MSAARIPEKPGVPVALVVSGIALLVALIPLAAAAIWLLYPSARHQPPPRIAAYPAPALEIAPVAAYASYAARERLRLAGAEGRLPIDAAMARIAARGPQAFAPLRDASPPAKEGR